MSVSALPPSRYAASADKTGRHDPPKAFRLVAAVSASRPRSHALRSQAPAGKKARETHVGAFPHVATRRVRGTAPCFPLHLIPGPTQQHVNRECLAPDSHLSLQAGNGPDSAAFRPGMARNRPVLALLSRLQSPSLRAESAGNPCYFLFLTGSNAVTPRRRLGSRTRFRALAASLRLAPTADLHTLHTLPVY